MKTASKRCAITSTARSTRLPTTRTVVNHGGPGAGHRRQVPAGAWPVQDRGERRGNRAHPDRDGPGRDPRRGQPITRRHQQRRGIRNGRTAAHGPPLPHSRRPEMELHRRMQWTGGLRGRGCGLGAHRIHPADSVHGRLLADRLWRAGFRGAGRTRSRGNSRGTWTTVQCPGTGGRVPQEAGRLPRLAARAA